MKKTAGILLTAAAVLIPAAASARTGVPDAYQNAKFENLVGSIGVCNTAADISEVTAFNNVNTDYYSGLISGAFADVNQDGVQDFVTVETTGIAVYNVDESGNLVQKMYYPQDLISNESESYANVVIKKLPMMLEEGEETPKIGEFICIETFHNNSKGKTYNFTMLKFTANEDGTWTVNKDIDIESTVSGGNEMQTVAGYGGVTQYSYTNIGDKVVATGTDKYENIFRAARDVFYGSGFVEDYFVSSYNRLWLSGDEMPDTYNINDTLISRIMEMKKNADYRLTSIMEADKLVYIHAQNINTGKPVVQIEDNGILETLVRENPIVVQINGKRLEFADQEPVIVNSRTLVPVRAIFEALGAKVDWLPEGKKIIANTADVNITMQIDNHSYYVNGEKKELDVAPQIMNDRTMVPVRAISESLGARVEWDDKIRTVYITQ